MRSQAERARRLNEFAARTLLPRLEQANRAAVERLFLEGDLSYQRLALLCQAVRDMEMWGEPPLARVLARLSGPSADALERLEEWIARRRRRRAYPQRGRPGVPPPRRRVVAEPSPDRTIWGMCPVESEETLCCRLRTIDAVSGCVFGCTYCAVQTFAGSRIRVEPDLAAKLDAVPLEAERPIHAGSGQSSDSLLWGDRAGVLTALVEFARRKPWVFLELKTKSTRVDELLALDPPRNVFCTWSLNPTAVVRAEEPGAPGPEERLQAARRAADHGLQVGFHFHPMIRYQGWEEGYAELTDRLRGLFHPREVAMVSMGALTLIKPVIREARRRGTRSRITQMEMTTDPKGKLTCTDQVKGALFRHLHGELADWHGHVYFYLCMERRQVWRDVFGWAYESNEAFEADMLAQLAARL